MAPVTVGAGAHNDITDVPGIRVGHAHRSNSSWCTGVTVVLPPKGTVAGVDVRGGAPGTRETDALDPHRLVQEVHAVCLTGGSAYGLAAADGVVGWLAERNIGIVVGPQPHHVVPVVPAAVLLDLGRGAWANRPDAAFGRRAVAAAAGRGGSGPVAQGCVGAGTGARAGGLKGGIGSASAVLPSGVTVGVLVALNAAGSTVLPASGELLGARSLLPRELGLKRPTRADAERAAAVAGEARTTPPRNTTLAIVATDADLTKVEAHKLAEAIHDGLARAIDPLHLMVDGDVTFSLATGTCPLGGRATTAYKDDAGRPQQLDQLLAAAATTASRAVVHAMVHAHSMAGMVAYADVCPSAFR